MPYRKTRKEMKIVTRHPARDGEKWSTRAVGPKAVDFYGEFKKTRTPNMAGFKDPKGPMRNEGSEYRKAMRWIKKDAQIKQALREKRGKP